MKWLLLSAIVFIQCNSLRMEEINKIHAFRLKPGADIRKEIEMFAKKENINAGWMVTCAGSLTQAHIRFANMQEGKKLNGHFEILSLTGTISKNGCHLHISISDSLGNTTGGHLLPESIIYTTAEIVIGENKKMIFTREKDGTTEWEELQITQ